MAQLVVNNVSKVYDGKTIIEDISITLENKEIVSLLGVSGAGKSTLFNIISGLIRPEEGQVVLDGKNITGKTGYTSYMLQKDLLLPFKTMEDNVALPLMIRGMSRKKAREYVRPYFDLFGLKGTETKYPTQLSGGMKQRAALLRTYMFSSDVALLDEPFSALDTITKGTLHKWYLNIMEKLPLSTLLITHDIDEAILLSDRIYLLTGTPGKITKEIKITEAKPRRSDFTLTQEFLAYKQEIIAHLGQ